MVSTTAPRRGCIYLVDFDPVRGSEQGKVRPALVVQNDVGNRASSTTIVAAITSARPSRRYPFHVWLPNGMLAKPSIVMCEQLRTIATEQIVSDAIAECSPELMGRVAAALVRSLAIKS
jgi:mRNA interferase MazF